MGGISPSNWTSTTAPITCLNLELLAIFVPSWQQCKRHSEDQVSSSCESTSINKIYHPYLNNYPPSLPALQTLRHSYLLPLSLPVDRCLPHSSVDPVLPRVVLLFLRCHHLLRPFPRVPCLLIHSHSLPRKHVVLALLLPFAQAGLSLETGGLYVVERRSKVDVHISFDDADSVILVFWFDLEDVDVELFPEDLNGDGVFLVETGEVP